MIAVDTNVVLRYLLDDHQVQSEKASRLFSDNLDILITDVVLVETMWTLAGKKYQLNKTALVNVVQALFEEPQIRFEDNQTVWLALNDYRKAKPVRGKVADFADALIIRKAEFMAASQNTRFNGAYTFDKASQVLPAARAPI